MLVVVMTWMVILALCEALSGEKWKLQSLANLLKLEELAGSVTGPQKYLSNKQTRATVPTCCSQTSKLEP